MKNLATCRVHWPTGPVEVCLEHARQLVAVGKTLGMYIYSEEIAPTKECGNCVKESPQAHAATERSEKEPTPTTKSK